MLRLCWLLVLSFVYRFSGTHGEEPRLVLNSDVGIVNNLPEERVELQDRSAAAANAAAAAAFRAAATAVGSGTVTNTNSSWVPGAPIGPNTSVPLGPGLNYLRQMLQMAVEVEHSVIPPYLSAMYSIVPIGTDQNWWYADVVKGVVIEEMLHMTIAANVLNAVGGAY